MQELVEIRFQVNKDSNGKIVSLVKNQRWTLEHEISVNLSRIKRIKVVEQKADTVGKHYVKLLYLRLASVSSGELKAANKLSK